MNQKKRLHQGLRRGTDAFITIGDVKLATNLQ